ncbi:MAG: hypothetical protein JWN48_4059, partial [Myxococcaceae bacterium]|nr:hypothetical protein [Myxococcaceae bacterium]
CVRRLRRELLGSQRGSIDHEAGRVGRARVATRSERLCQTMTRCAAWSLSAWLGWLVLSSCGAEERGPSASIESSLDGVAATIDVRRSLAVTDLETLQRFTFQRVMDTLARDARVKGLTGIALFKQWWDTQNMAPSSSTGPHCNDEVDASGRTLLNSFPYDCRPQGAEGAQASCSSFDDPACAYIPIGLFNRFDLAPEDGSNCGEHRILFAKQSGQADPKNRNLLIFEARLANPAPHKGAQGCRRLIETWASLSSIDSVSKRAALLERMYFEGVGEFPPIVSWPHFGDNEHGWGQIRTNQFMITAAPFIWTLREFKTRRTCERPNDCSARMVPVTDKNNPIGLLFGDPAANPRAAAFQQQLLRDNLSGLAATSLTDISLTTPETFDSGQSHSSGSSEMDYLTPLATQRARFRRELWTALGALGSGVTPEQLALRARTQTCAGCHQLSNNEELGDGLFWPPSLGFVHVSEVLPETVDGVTRYRISPLLLSSFLPLRSRVMFDFLQQRPWRRRGLGQTVGGRFTH